jgi:hypothetical protein
MPIRPTSDSRLALRNAAMICCVLSCSTKRLRMTD